MTVIIVGACACRVQVYDWLLTVSRLSDDVLTPDLRHCVTGKLSDGQSSGTVGTGYRQLQLPVVGIVFLASIPSPFANNAVGLAIEHSFMR